MQPKYILSIRAISIVGRNTHFRRSSKAKRDVRFIFFKKKKKMIVTGEGAQLRTPQTHTQAGTTHEYVQYKEKLAYPPLTQTHTESDICVSVCLFIFHLQGSLERKKIHRTTHQPSLCFHQLYANTTQRLYTKATTATTTKVRVVRKQCVYFKTNQAPKRKKKTLEPRSLARYQAFCS